MQKEIAKVESAIRLIDEFFEAIRLEPLMDLSIAPLNGLAFTAIPMDITFRDNLIKMVKEERKLLEQRLREARDGQNGTN